MTNTNHCPFCDSAQAYRYLLEGSQARALYPKAPACRFHLLLTPKRHVATLDQLTSAETSELFVMLQNIVQAAKENITGFAGYNILSNNGDDSIGQRVKHTHVHVFLRTFDEPVDPVRTPSHSGTPPPLNTDELADMQFLQKLFASQQSPQ